MQTRARLQRMGDAKFFSGWVKEISDTELWLRTSGELPVTVGEKYVVQLFGTGFSAIIKLKLSVTMGNLLGFAITATPMEISSDESARVAVSGMLGTLMADGTAPCEVTVLDMSVQGVGLLSPISVDRGAQVILDLVGRGGSISAEGEVRYCRPDPQTEGYFKVGVKIRSLQRIDQARWNQMLTEAA